MSVRLRTAMNLASALALAGALLLGALWLGDRARRWERPRWTSDLFVPLRAGRSEDRGDQARWAVAVNPRCPHCMTTMWRLHASWARFGRRQELVALIVDTPARPDAHTLRAIPPVPVWWDRNGVWRRRWGHRLYGELIQFDASGCFVRTLAAEEVLRRMRLPDPGGSSAPARSEQGGT